MKLSELAAKVSCLSDAASRYWEAELPKRHPNYPLVNPGEDSGPPPPEQLELEELFRKLPADMVYQLLLLMHLGRGDFDTSDLAGEFQELKKRFEDTEWAASEMIERDALAEYLVAGMAELKRNNINVDHLP